jgi:hypothetical protein
MSDKQEVIEKVDFKRINACHFHVKCPYFNNNCSGYMIRGSLDLNPDTGEYVSFMCPKEVFKSTYESKLESLFKDESILKKLKELSDKIN